MSGWLAVVAVRGLSFSVVWEDVCVSVGLRDAQLLLFGGTGNLPRYKVISVLLECLRIFRTHHDLNLLLLKGWLRRVTAPLTILILIWLSSVLIHVKKGAPAHY